MQVQIPLQKSPHIHNYQPTQMGIRRTPTVLQKVVDSSKLDSYLSRTQYSTGVSGSITKLSDVQDLKTYKDTYNALP